MKVVLLNGSPHEAGCTFTALSEVAKELNKNGVETEILQLGKKSGARLYRLRQLCENREMCL